MSSIVLQIHEFFADSLDYGTHQSVGYRKIFSSGKGAESLACAVFEEYPSLSSTSSFSLWGGGVGRCLLFTANNKAV